MSSRGSKLMRGAARAVHDYATGPDGRTFAIGRALGGALFAGATPLPVLIGLYTAVTQRPTLAEWGSYLAPAGVYYGAVATAAVALIQLTNWSEPTATTAEGGA